MKVSVPFLVFVLNILFESTIGENLDEGRKYLDEEQPEVDTSVMGKEWPEQHFPSTSEEKLQREDLNLEADKSNDDEKLFGKNYYRVDGDDSSSEKDSKPIHYNVEAKADPHELKQYKKEIAAGDVTELFGTNSHYYQPEVYIDLSRRFVPQYPYKEVAETELIEEAADNSLTPKFAPPELVLAVAKESALLEATRPVNPTEHLIEKNSLRTGEYWNAFWKEDVDPIHVLRTSDQNKMKSIRVKLSPGTKLYAYVSQLQQPYHKLLYVINKKH